MKIVKDASLILRFHTCGPWGVEVPFITIRSIGEGYKNWTVGMWQKVGGRAQYATVLGLSRVTDHGDTQVRGAYRSWNTSGSWSSEDRLFFDKAHNDELVS